MKFRPALGSRLARIGLFAIATLIAGAPIAAQAQGASLAILGLSSKDGDDDAAATLTDALRSEAAEDPELQLSDSSALLSQLVALHDCEIADAACRETIAAQLEVGELIYGTIRRGTFGHTVELHRYVVADGSLSHASRELTIEGAGVSELVREAGSLLRELRPAETPEERVPALVVEPEQARRRPLAEPEPEVEEPSSNDWLGYTLLGVAAASTGLLVYSWSEIDAAKSNASLREYREAVGRAQGGDMIDDVCGEAEDGEAYGLGDRLENVRGACRRGETFEILQWVFAGTALVGVGVGTYFLLDDEDEPGTSRASIAPIFGKGDAGLRLRIRL